MSKDIEVIKKECVDRWQENDRLDERLTNFSENFPKWIEKIPKDARDISITLIKNFDYYSHIKTNKLLKELHNKLLHLPNVKDDNTVFTFIKSKHGKSNSSNDYWAEYKLINEVNTHICYVNLDKIDDCQWNSIKNIVFIDDFGGSGDTFLSELKKKPMRYKNKNVYFITIAIMSDALDIIEDYCKQKSIKINVIYGNKQNKAFERGLFKNENFAKFKVCEISKEFGIPKTEYLGYKECQSLVAFYNNTPNNTLGFIRYDTHGYNSLFPRKHEKKPYWQTLKQQKNNRKKTNYNNIKGGD